MIESKHWSQGSILDLNKTIEVRTYELIALNRFARRLNPIWELGIRPSMMTVDSITQRKPEDPPFLLPCDAFVRNDAKERCLRQFNPGGIQFQTGLFDITNIENFCKLTNYKIQLWIHRELTDWEQTKIQEFLHRIEPVYILSKRLNIQKLHKSAVFQRLNKITFFMPPQKANFLPWLDLDRTYAQLLYTKRNFPEKKITSLVLTNGIELLNTSTRDLLFVPHITNFVAYLKDNKMYQYYILRILLALKSFKRKFHGT